MTVPSNKLSPFDGLLDTLELLIAQGRAYERALSPDNFPARSAVASLGDLARQAINETRDLSSLLENPLRPIIHYLPVDSK